MVRRSTPDPGPRRGLYILLALLMVTAVHADRVPVPAPPGGGDGINVFPEDQQDARDVMMAPPVHPAIPARGSTPDSATRGEVGGDDVEVARDVDTSGADLAVASDGTLFAAVGWEVGAAGTGYLVVRRSVDGGTTWHDWAVLDHPDPGFTYEPLEIHVAEGAEDRVFVAYILHATALMDELHVAWSSLDLASGDFSADTRIHAGSSVHDFDFTTDAASFSGYYTYVVYSAYDAVGGSDIHFARSIDQGTTWETPYVIAAIAVDDRGYSDPQIAVGHGGYVHVVWALHFHPDVGYDECLRYRRASDWAAGGLASWAPMQSLTSHVNGIDEFWPQIGASVVSEDVLVTNVRYVVDGAGRGWDGVDTRASADAGAAWSPPTRIGVDYSWSGDLIHQATAARWLVACTEYSDLGYFWAPVADPTSWSDHQDFADGLYSGAAPDLVLDPAHGHRVAAICGDPRTEEYVWFFDAEWRADPGYPVTEPGFPVDLAAEPVSDPALADLDRDGDLEIVFGDAAGRLHAVRGDGVSLPGWPLHTGQTLSDSPVAVGDLDGDGELTVVAGTVDGLILAYDAQAQPLPGWPYDTARDFPVYLAIGAIGGPYPRAVIWGCGNRLFALDYHGEAYPGVLGRGFSTRTFTHPPAVGDVDGDGRSEVVVSIADDVYAFPMMSSTTAMTVDFDAVVSGPVALGDLDLDGDVEVVVPLANGALHVLDDDGGAFPGAWPAIVHGSELAGVAVANCLGGGEPEIAVAARDAVVSVYWYDGVQGIGWPTGTDSWPIDGKPIMGTVELSPDVIIGAGGGSGWTWDNFGQVNPGWPKLFADPVHRTPAYGDLDLDGRAEIVFLTATQLIVLDVTTPPGPAEWTWAMAGHDPERSGCADCPLDLVPVADDPDRVTRVSMAAPHPNPIAGQASFAFAVPVRAVAELAIHDVRGRRVALVSRQEVPAGRHVFEWLGRDGAGRPVASGQYLATLRVRGPGVDEHLTRKITVLR